MNRNKILITILSLIGVMFVALLLLLTREPQIIGLSQQTTTKQQAAETQVELVRAILLPEIVETTTNQTITIKLTYQNLKSPLQASDLLLSFNNDLLEFVEVSSLHSAFINPRALITDEGYLILSFVENKTQTEPVAEELIMADIIFRTKATGKVTLSPIINRTANSSMAIVKDSTDNQLTSVNSVSIQIK